MIYPEVLVLFGGISAVLGLCWWMEIRTLNKVRDGHSEHLRRLREEHRNELDAMRLRSKDEGWMQGVEYQRNLMTRKRDKAGRFA